MLASQNSHSTASEERSLLATLARVDLFRTLPPEALAILADRGQRRSFRPGSQIVRQGEASDSLHVVLRGAMRIERSHPQLTGPVVLGRLGPGDLVGSGGLLDGAASAVTVTVLRPTETLELGAAALALALASAPDHGAGLVAELRRRLRAFGTPGEPVERGGPEPIES